MREKLRIPLTSVEKKDQKKCYFFNVDSRKNYDGFKRSLNYIEIKIKFQWYLFNINSLF